MIVRKEAKYYGKLKSVRNALRGAKLVRVFTLEKEYNLHEAEKILQSKIKKIEERLDRRANEKTEDPGFEKLEKDVAELSRLVKALRETCG